MLIQQLRAIQDRFGFIPQQELKSLSDTLNLPLYHVHGVASYYPHFRLTPAPKASVHVCTDLCCHLRGAAPLLDQLRDLATAHDGVEVRSCSCLGQCDGAPAALINGLPYARLQPGGLLDLAQQAMRGERLPPQHHPRLRGPFRIDPYENESGRYGAIAQLAASGDVASVIPLLKEANLRGMGGGGFAAHLKWSTVRAQGEPQKYIICNADESEVGTFKDRELLRTVPHLVIEAMAIAGLATGATRGFIYIRHEYHEQIEILQEEIGRALARNVLGDNILGSGQPFHLEVFVSPGGYVQGEETALMEAIEGKRGQPRNKPCIPAINGLWQKPTIINNVETLAYVPCIVIKGPEWFKSQGVNGCQGIKWIGVGGHVNQPGVFEVPMGTPFSEAIRLAGGVLDGRPLKAFTPSGPSFGFLPARNADIPIDFPDPVRKNPIYLAGATIGSAAILAVAEGTDMVDLALNFTRFYRNESCGKCVPCRVGSQKLVDIIASLMEGHATRDDLATIARLADTLDMTSICGLGQVVSKPIQSVLKYWPEEVEAYLARNAAAIAPQEASGEKEVAR